MGKEKPLTEKELITLTLQKAMMRLNNAVLLSTGSEITDNY